MRTVIVTEAGDKFELDAAPPTIADQVAWEAQFRRSAVAIEQAGIEARQAREDDRPVNPELAMRVEWMLFFAWRQLRRDKPGSVPSKFDVFQQSVADLRFEAEDDSDVVDQEDEGVDPTAPGDRSDPAP